MKTNQQELERNRLVQQVTQHDTLVQDDDTTLAKTQTNSAMSKKGS